MNRNLIEKSLERYLSVNSKDKDILGEQILDTVETQIHLLLDEWIDKFSIETDSNVYKELIKLRFEKRIFN